MTPAARFSKLMDIAALEDGAKSAVAYLLLYVFVIVGAVLLVASIIGAGFALHAIFTWNVFAGVACLAVIFYGLWRLVVALTD